MKGYYQLALILILVSPLAADPFSPAIKAAPVRPSVEANVVVEDHEILETCDTEQICVQGWIHNNGAKPAYQTKLRIEIGGTKRGRPRHTIIQKMDNPVMEPGDRQEFYLTIDRKIKTKDGKGEEKILEVGKFNFKIVPVWSTTKAKTIKTNKKK